MSNSPELTLPRVQRAWTDDEIHDLICQAARSNDEFALALLSRRGVRPDFQRLVSDFLNLKRASNVILVQKFFPGIIDTVYNGLPLLEHFATHEERYVRDLLINSADQRRTCAQARDILTRLDKGAHERSWEALSHASMYFVERPPGNFQFGFLHTAIAQERVDLVWACLNAGSSPNSTMHRGHAFNKALTKDMTECVLVLIGYGADCNLISRDGNPLWNAITSDNHQLLCTLLDRGADPNSVIGATSLLCKTIEEARTPTMFTELPAINQMACVLILAGADLYARNVEGRLYLDEVFPGGDEQIDAFVAEHFPSLPGRARMTKACREW